MNIFLPHIFKFGFCLTGFYLVYFLFLRKETLYNFNRYYLLVSIVFSLLIPVVPVSINYEPSSKLSEQAYKLMDYRSSTQNMWDDFEYLSPAELGIYFFEPVAKQSLLEKKVEDLKSRSLQDWIYLIYMLGVSFYLARFIIRHLFLWRFLSSCQKRNLGGVNLRLSEENVSPFSYFHILVIDKQTQYSPDIKNILAHEAIHIKQKHSVDSLFIELLSSLAWFHPFVWMHKSAIRENHEFLADRGALIRIENNQQSYKELILKQLISSTTFELASSLNFKPIKRRIKMMNKSKSNKKASLKVLAALPLAALLFLLFANFTVSKNSANVHNSAESRSSQLDGIWIAKSSKNLDNMVSFEHNTMYVMEQRVPVTNYKFSIKGNEIVLDKSYHVSIPFKKTGDKLRIWWTEVEATDYVKVQVENSMELMKKQNGYNFKPIKLSEYKFLEKSFLVTNLVIDGVKNPKFYLNGKEVKFGKLKQALLDERKRIPKLNLALQTVSIFADQNLPMTTLQDVRQILQETHFFKLAYSGVPTDQAPKVMYHACALSRKLPPLQGDKGSGVPVAQVLNIDEGKNGKLMAGGLTVMEVTPTNRSKNKIRSLIEKNKEYVFAVAEIEKMTYQEYISIQEDIQQVVYEFRNQYAFKNFGKKYANLNPDEAKKVRKVYPLAISEADIQKN